MTGQILPTTYSRNKFNGKIPLLYFDLTLQPDNCNFHCDYCLSKEAPEWTEEKSIYFSQEGRQTYYTSLLEKTTQFFQFFDVPIMRVSGGEVLRLPGFLPFLDQISKHVEIIQIITNGYYMDNHLLQQILQNAKIQIHLSLDGHNISLNGLRIKKETVQNRLMNNLNQAVQMKIPVEIGSVITKQNSSRFDTFLDYLLQYDKKIIVYPFPVRGAIAESFLPNEKEIHALSNIFSNPRFYSILPPKPYFDLLLQVLREKKRRLRCLTSIISTQMFEDGTLTPCPNGWFQSTLTLDSQLSDIDMHEMYSNKLYDLLTYRHPKVPFCKKCFTALDIANLYLEGHLTEKQLQHSTLFKNQVTMSRIQFLKKQYLDRG